MIQDLSTFYIKMENSLVDPNMLHLFKPSMWGGSYLVFIRQRIIYNKMFHKFTFGSFTHNKINVRSPN